MRDPYTVLGVARGCSADELKKAYRGLAMQYHPDRNPGNAEAEKKFKEINQAYDILKDEDKRAAYDRYGEAAFTQSGGGAQPNFSEIFEEIFGDFMGGGRPNNGGAARGNDLRFNLEITLEQAYSGIDEKIRVPAMTLCEACGGDGAEGDSLPTICPTCRGAGRVRMTQGFFTLERTCPTCAGTAQVIEKPCKVCAGAGRVRKEKSLAVKIPMGVDNGTRIRLAGEGDIGQRGGPPGDLYIFLTVTPHKIYSREGADLHMPLLMPMTTAALGGTMTIPLIEGTEETLRIEPGCQPASIFKLKGKGMPRLRPGRAEAPRGDLIITTQLEVPVNLNKKQQELLQEFAATLQPNQQPAAQAKQTSKGKGAAK